MQISAQTHHFSMLTRAIRGFECHPVKPYITLELFVHYGEIEVQVLVVSGDCMVHITFFFFFFPSLMSGGTWFVYMYGHALQTRS